MEFLYVRWLPLDSSYQGAKRLHRVGYMGPDDEAAFGLLDPQLIIRATHLIPAFEEGHTTRYLPKSLVRRPEQNDEDWLYYYVNLCVFHLLLLHLRLNIPQFCRSGHADALHPPWCWTSQHHLGRPADPNPSTFEHDDCE